MIIFSLPLFYVSLSLSVFLSFFPNQHHFDLDRTEINLNVYNQLHDNNKLSKILLLYSDNITVSELKLKELRKKNAM